MPRPHSRAMVEPTTLIDAQHAPALALHLLDRRQGVEGLARLADGDIERVLLDHRVAVAELRGRLGMRRECAPAARSGARRRARRSRPSRSPGSSPGGCPASRARPARCRPGARSGTGGPAGPQRAPHGLRLLGDLLPHEVREVALVEGRARPAIVAASWWSPRRPASASVSRRRGPRPSRRRPGAPRCGAWPISAAASEATNISRSPTPTTTGPPLRAATMRLGPRRVDHRQAIGALHQPQRRAHAPRPACSRAARDQVRQHLGVGLASGRRRPSASSRVAQRPRRSR